MTSAKKQRLTLKIDEVSQPVETFYETKKYSSISKDSASENLLILQCHGYPGTGKSQIMRKLARNFPYNEKESYVRWHISCIGNKDEVKKGLKLLVERLRDKDVAPMREKYKEIIENMYKDTPVASPLTNGLRECGADVLIIIEDATKESLPFLKEFLKSVSEQGASPGSKFHIYIVTRSKTAIFQVTPKYLRQEKVDGFKRREGIKFLMLNLEEGYKTVANEQAAEQVFDRFSGSPLGLQLAKAFCQKARLNYSDYLEMARADEGADEIPGDLEKEYGKKAKNIFQAITMPFRINDESDKDAILLWKVLSSLSYLHHDSIPRFVLQQFCQEFRQGLVKNVNIQNKRESGVIINKLIDHGMCSLNKDEDITFHEVIMRAIKSHHHVITIGDKTFYPLKSTVSVFSGLITKDLRLKEKHNKISKLIPHGKALLKNVEDQKENLKGKDSLVFWMTISHLYETFATIFLVKSELFHHLCDDYFMKALDIIWQSSSDHCSLTESSKNSGSIEDIAKHVVSECKEAGEELTQEVVTRYEAIVLNLTDKNEQQFLEQQIPCANGRKEFEKALNTNMAALDLMNLLRKYELFLSWEEQQTIFFAERVASILHSWSRVILCKDAPDPTECERYMWLSSLASAICKQCREIGHIRLLTEHITVTSGVIPITLKAKREESELDKAKDLCEKAIDEKENEDMGAMYEHGLLKEFYGPKHHFKRIAMLGHLVRIYSRLFKREPDNAKFKEKGNLKCVELFDLAKEKINDISNAWLWIIHCAKFYAGCKQYEKSLVCYKEYFKQKENEAVNVSSKGHSWAVYNYARTILAGRLCDHCKEAISKCEDILKPNQIVSPDLQEKIKDILGRLKGISSSA